MTDDNLSAERQLRTRVAEEMGKLGLELAHFAIIVSENSETPDHIQAVFLIDPAKVGQDDDERRIDAEVDQFRTEMERELLQQRLDSEEAEMKQALQNRLRKMGGGFLSDGS